MEKVILGGGSGFIGRSLKKMLTDNGHKVTIISRLPGTGRKTWIDLERHGIPEDTTVVINVAGVNVMNPYKRWNAQFQESVRSSRIDTNKKFVSYISEMKTPPKVFATISGVACYEPSPTAVYTEDSPIHEFDFMSKLVIDWEAAAKLPENLATRQFTVRSGVVLGGDGGMILELYPKFFFGAWGRIGSGTQWLPWIQVSDLVSIFHHGLMNDSVSGVLNGVAPNPACYTDFACALGQSMSRLTILPMPSFLFSLLLGSERAKLILEGQNVSPKRMLESGYTFQYPDIESACHAAVSEVKWTSFFPKDPWKTGIFTDFK